MVNAPNPRTAPVRRSKRRITVGLATTLAAAALIFGLIAGYVARGGPPDPVLVTTQQDIPVVTVTTESPVP